MPSSAELIRSARTQAGLTQAELARRIETTQSAIARLEGGRTEPSLARLDLIVRACGGTLAVELNGIWRRDPRLDEPFQQRWDNAIRMANFVLRGREAVAKAGEPT